jgi:hypothetical protein
MKREGIVALGWYQNEQSNKWDTEMTRKYLVFLDIDGVFTSSRVHYAHNAVFGIWHRFDPVAVDFMNKIHDRYPVQFVLISTWKDHLRNDDKTIAHWIRSAFSNSGFRGSFPDLWKTDPDNLWPNKPAGYNRSHEIRDYLADHATDVLDYIIFDDNNYGFDQVLGRKRLIRTDPENGLLFKHMKRAQSLMGQWHEK